MAGAPRCRRPGVLTVRSDSPSPEWYEPPDLIEDDELADLGDDTLAVLAGGVVTWCSPATTTTTESPRPGGHRPPGLLTHEEPTWQP